MLKSEKAQNALIIVLAIASGFCFLGVVGVWRAAFHDHSGFAQAGFEANRPGLLLAYALASVGVALLIGICRMIKAEHEASREAADDNSRASST